MNLILQAIKSLFRNLENSIAVNVTALTKKVDRAQTTANLARTRANDAHNYADSAWLHADEAKTVADNAQTTADSAKYVLKANVANNIATVQGAVTLENGKLYTIIPDSTSTSSGSAYISVNGTRYIVYCGVVENSISGTSTVKLQARYAFAKNYGFLVLYSAEKECFYSIRHINVTVMKAGGHEKNPNIDQYVYVPGTNLAAPDKIKYMRVKSSTENSTKLFDIQVDDTGKMATVNVETGEVVETGVSVSDEHINALIDAKLGVIENGTY